MSERRTLMEPTLGQIVHYRLNQTAVDAYNSAREKHPNHHGLQNDHTIDHVVPILVTSVNQGRGENDQPTINGHVFYNANAYMWFDNIKQGDQPGEWRWPPQA